MADTKNLKQIKVLHEAFSPQIDSTRAKKEIKKTTKNKKDQFYYFWLESKPFKSKT